MAVRKKSIVCLMVIMGFIPSAIAITQIKRSHPPATHIWAHNTIAQVLGWVASDENYCGGYYLEPPFSYPVRINNPRLLELTSTRGGMISQRGTSVLQDVTVTRDGQQMTADKAYVYRDPKTHKLSVIDLIGNVHLREPFTLVIAQEGKYQFVTHAKSLTNVIYRTSLLDKQLERTLSIQAREETHKVTALTAWGSASQFAQTEPKVYQFYKTSFSTCPPTDPAWQVKASHIELNKKTGRGYATNARFLIKNMPVLYTPYISFPIDRRRKTGFLWPTLGAGSSFGPYVMAPFYWNMAPNYDMTFTPGFLSKRGVQLSNYFRYLTEHNSGKMNLSVLPNDRMFAAFQKSNQEKFQNSPVPATQAELNRLLNASTTRKGFWWRDDSQFNEHWSSHIDFNYAGDDYYYIDLGNDLNEITTNQLLQEAELYYKSENWNITGRVQTYQTLHPIESKVLNQYRRFPQLIVAGDYPDQPFGFEYFITSEVTHFEILNDPGAEGNKPVGNRLHAQPGVSLPMYWPFFYVNPRVQLALTDYNLYQREATLTPKSIHRALPIVDVLSGFALNRDIALFGHAFQQTLEPQAYYTYIPYRDQRNIPIFDTTVNTLTYDQIFNYNRFSGIDRIGDANQIGIGVTTRFIDSDSGFEKVRLGVGDIVYFANRNVTLCNDSMTCQDNPNNHSNYQRLSPLSGVLNYFVNPSWRFDAYTIWNPVSKQLDSSILMLHFQPDSQRIINLGFNFVRGGDILSGIETSSPSNNLKVTDFSFAWPVLRDISVFGRWSQNWNHRHLQNLLYGLQYDTCCWAVRMVGGRAFAGLDQTNNNQFKYNNQFYIQFALKGLGNIGTGNPNGLLSSITGYNTQFGQEI